jgi:hypothetical protein
MRSLFVAYLVAAASMLFACGHDSKPAPKGTATPTDFCHALVATVSELQTRCFGGGESFWTDLYSRLVPCDDLAKQIADGSIVYDQAKGARCLDQVKALACDSTIDADANACADALVGQVPGGNACARSSLVVFDTCAPGHTCTAVANSCAGVCRPVAQPGSSCAYSSSTGSVTCADGSSCQLNTDLCVEDVAEGQACQGPSAGDCGYGLVCEVGTGETAGTCRKRRTSGACASLSDCAASYVCSGPEGARTCRKAKLPGDSCTPGMGECYYFLTWCGSDGTCTDTGAQENEPCGAQGQDYRDNIPCASGLTCASNDAGVGTCRKRKPAGSPCTFGSECAGTDAYCDSATKLCVSCE